MKNLLLAAAALFLTVASAEVKQLGNLRDRQPDFPPVTWFQNAEEFTIAVENGGSARLNQDNEHRFFGKSGGSVRLNYENVSAKTVIRVMLKKPLPIKNVFSQAEIYLWGTKWGYSRAFVPYLIVKNKSGEEEKINYAYYHYEDNGPILYHNNLREKYEGYTFCGVEFAQFTRPKGQVHIGPVSFFHPGSNTSSAKAISNAEARKGRGIVPFTKGKNSIRKAGNAWLIQCGDIVYRYTPSKGFFSELTAVINGKKVTPFADGGLLIGNEKLPRESKLKSCQIRDGKLVAEFVMDGKNAFSITLTPVGKTLTIDVTSHNPFASKVVLGCITGLKKPKLIEIPYLCYWGITNGTLGPRVVCDDAGNFMLAMFDPYVTNSSDLYAAEKNGFIRRRAVYANGGASYFANTAGKLNNVDERIVLTVSKELSDVLPNIDNPDPINKEDVARRVYSSWPHVYRFVPDLYYAMGFRDLSHIIIYASAPPMEQDWGTGREKGWSEFSWKEISPQEFKKICSGYGYEFCVYEYLLGMQIGDYYWNRNWLLHASNGQFFRGCAPYFVTKPTILGEYRKKQDSYLKGVVNGIYSDVLTVGCPWGGFTDYDAAVPGAASCRGSYRAIQGALREIQETYGKCWSEGSFNWLYSGNCTGSYGSIMTFTEGGPSVLPIIPEFKLRRMQTKEATLSMGPSLGRLFERNKAFKPDGTPNNRFFDQALAAVMGYGNQTILISSDYSYFGFTGVAKCYYMGKGIQKKYTFQPVKSIEYFDGGKAVPSSEAIARDIHLAGRLKVVYENGTTVFVNYNGEKNWEIVYDGKKFTLPAWGFYAVHPASKTVSASILIDGKRCEYSQCDEYFYMDTRGQKLTFNGITLKGAAAFRKSSDGKLQVIPLGEVRSYRRIADHFGCEELAIDIKKWVPGYKDGVKIEVSCGALAGDKNQKWLFYRQGKKDRGILDKTRHPVPFKTDGGNVMFQPSGYYINYFVGVK